MQKKEIVLGRSGGAWEGDVVKVSDSKRVSRRAVKIRYNA